MPICKECWWEIVPKHLVISGGVGWGLVGLGIYLGTKLQGGFGIAAFFVCLLASRVIRDLNPLGVSFREVKDAYIWEFPNPVYAYLFARLNRGSLHPIHDLAEEHYNGIQRG